MARRPRCAFSTYVVGALALAVAGCGSNASQSGDAAAMDADFAVCMGTPAAIYMPGIVVMSSSGAYVASLDSALTEGTPAVTGPEVGLGTWTVSMTNAADGTPADVTMMAERPWMPLHGHGATTFPAVTPGDPGKFTVSEIDFFMAGYWQQKLDLTPASGVADKVTFDICVPQ
jgi:hypothetical protein